jgi:poly(hydroxyalkanoate) depolymerase family esterase
MHPDLQRLIQHATRLTRQGDLKGATQAIQSALRGDDPGRAGAGTVIDVEAREVPDGEGAALPGPQAPGAQDNGGAGAQARGAEERAATGRAATADAPAVDPAARHADAAPHPDAPEAFLTGRHGGEGLAGRDFKLYVPPGAGREPRPLVVMLHGCTQDPDDFARGTRMNEAAREQGFYVLYPAQSQRANPQRCWNWFKPSHQARGRGEAALVAGMVRQVMAQHAIDLARVYVAGLSAGGAMAANLAEAYPDLFAAAGVHSGLTAGAARDLKSALDAMKRGAARPPASAPAVPTIVFHGDADGTVHPANGEQVLGALPARSSAQVEERPSSGSSARAATRHIYRDAAGTVLAEHWRLHGGSHAWSGGSARGSYTDPRGPDATAEMLRFFREHPRRVAAA